MKLHTFVILLKNLIFMPKKIAILQSNYIPWKGYFDLINCVDEFVVFDDVQFTKRDWRNRNKLKTPTGTAWLTVPVKVAGKFEQLIKDTEIENDSWSKKHWKFFEMNYKRSKYFNEVCEFLEDCYLETPYKYLSELNMSLIKKICSYLDINTKFSHSSDFNLVNEKSSRLLEICKQANATEYISGPAAKNYLNTDLFDKSKINVSWFNYSSYPEYPQLWGEFVHEVSILDLLFNCGKDSIKYLQRT